MLSAIIFALLIWTIWGNTALTVNNIKISSSRIPAVFSGFRIAQVSDLHNAEFGKGNKKLLELLSESKPDIIVITGDFVDAGHTDIDVAFDFAKVAVNMITKVSNNENAESGLLPYPVIIAATKGDPEAMAIVVKHYESYIASLSMRKLRDERGNTYWGIDEDIRDRLRSRLMRAVLSFEV